MAKSNKTFPKNNALSKLAVAIVCVNSGMALAEITASTGPSGHNIGPNNGTAEINVSTDTLTTTINQKITAGSDIVTIEWNTFNVGENHTVNFVQDAGDVAINNILDADPSSILGNIEADGTVFLSNPNGFVFGATSSVNTGAFMATTSAIVFDNSNETISLTENAASGSINIHNNASINANNQTDGGYLAFISKNIVTEGTASADNSSAGLHADNGEVLISNDAEAVIKLAGLNINFPASDFKGATVNNINLTDATISGESVILTSKNLTDLLDNVIKQPKSLTIENLSFSAPDVTVSNDISISKSIENSFKLLEASESKNALSIKTDTFTTNNTIDISNTSGLSNANKVELNISANTVSIDHNINASNLDLTLEAATSVTISDLSQSFGGESGFNSLSATANNIFINENINTKNDLTLNGDVSINVASFDPFLQSISGDIIVNGSLKGTHIESGFGELFLIGNNIYLNAVSGFNSVDLEANNIYLSGDISANRIASNNQSNILLRTDVIMNAQSIEFDSATFTSAPENLKTPNVLYSLNLVGTASGAGSENRFILNDTRISAGNGLKELNIKSLNDETTTNIFLGGKYDTAKFCIHSCASTGTTEIDYNTVLTSNTDFNDIDALNFSESSLSGDYKLTAMGSADSFAGLSLVTGLDGLSFTNFDTITLRDDISTKEQGLELFSKSIKIENTSKDDKTVLISNSNSGKITIGDVITRSDDGIVSSPMSSTISSDNGSSLTISTKNSEVYLGTVNQLANLSISKELQDEGSTVIANKIITSDSISFNNLGTITSAQNSDASINKTLTLEAANNITLTDSDLITPDHDINLTSNDIKLERITASNINLDATNIELSGDLYANNELNLLESNATTNIVLTQDLTLTGEMDILSEANSNAKITGRKNLYLISKNSEIYLSSFNTEGDLNSLSITTLDSEEPANIHVTSDAEGLIKTPLLSGAQGLSLLGHMTLDLGENKTTFFDTSSYDGNLNLSGVSITGLGALKFDTGTGELSLGDIGTNNSDSQIFDTLDIQSTGKLNIHGELNIQSKKFDFSKLNSIDLYTDLTLGSTDALVAVNFGSASINGTHDLSLFTTELTLSSVGNNIALQDLNIFNVSDTALVLDNDITVVGSVNINSTSLELDNSITNTGLAVNISTIGDLIMKKDSVINADYSDIFLTSTTGNIGIGKLFAGNTVTARSELGYLYNNINDYVSNDSTSTNITSTNQNLYGLVNIGESVSSPIVINAQNGGTITAESSGTIYIANLANARMNATGRVIDGSTGGETATIDAFTQFKLSSLNTTNLPTLSSNLELISNQTWQVDEDESIRKIKSPSSAPSIYYSRNGWRLGHR